MGAKIPHINAINLKSLSTLQEIKTFFLNSKHFCLKAWMPLWLSSYHRAAHIYHLQNMICLGLIGHKFVSSVWGSTFIPLRVQGSLTQSIYLLASSINEIFYIYFKTSSYIHHQGQCVKQILPFPKTTLNNKQ